MNTYDQRIEQLSGLESAYCDAQANEEFLELCKTVVMQLVRKKARPLATGTLCVWAAGIVHAVGFINFAFDKTAEFRLSQDSLAADFRCARPSVENRSREIRRILQMRPLDAKYAMAANRESRQAKSVNFERKMKETAAAFKMIVKDRKSQNKKMTVRVVQDQGQGGSVCKEVGTVAASEYSEIAAKLKAIGPTIAIERSLYSFIERYPDFAEAYDALAYVLEYQGLAKRAREILETRRLRSSKAGLYAEPY